MNRVAVRKSCAEAMVSVEHYDKFTFCGFVSSDEHRCRPSLAHCGRDQCHLFRMRRRRGNGVAIETNERYRGCTHIRVTAFIAIGIDIPRGKPSLECRWIMNDTGADSTMSIKESGEIQIDSNMVSEQVRKTAERDRMAVDIAADGIGVVLTRHGEIPHAH